ncbi:MAG: YciI family protein [Cellulomonas sp.]
MRYMLMQAYGAVELEDCLPMSEWAPEDVRAHIDFQHTLNTELLDSGELVDAQGLAGPDAATFVVSDGVHPPRIIDGPYPESKELLAGYRLIDVDGRDRALEIAARASAAPGPGGAPIQQPIEVRQVLAAPDPEV